MADYWTEDGLFHHMGKAYGLDKNCRTVVVPEIIETASQDSKQSLEKSSGDGSDIPVTDNGPKCVICNGVIPGKRADRRYCSPKCRKAASRKQLALVQW